MITIGLLTNDITSGNYGVNALSISNLLFLEEICGENDIRHKYFIFDNPAKDVEYMEIFSKISGLEKIDFKLLHGLELRKPIKTGSMFYNAIKKCDIVFDTSGGDSFADIYGNIRILHQLLPKIITNINKVPLVFTPQTIGPFKHKLWKRMAQRVAQKSCVIYVRDKVSYDFCVQELKLNNVIGVTDMAMRLPYTIDTEKSKNHPLRVGINVSGLLYNGGYNQKNQFGLKSSYKDTIHKLITMLQDSYDCEIHLVPHVVAKGIEGDNIVCAEIINNFPSVIYEEHLIGPIDAKTCISKMDVFIGSRMHSTIASLSSGVPTIPLSYSRKFEGLFSSLGYEECINLKEFDSNQVLQLIINKIDNLEELQESTDRAKLEIQKKLNIYKASLCDILKTVCK